MALLLPTKHAKRREPRTLLGQRPVPFTFVSLVCCVGRLPIRDISCHPSWFQSLLIVPASVGQWPDYGGQAHQVGRGLTEHSLSEDPMG
jgi:hypothetical protein